MQIEAGKTYVTRNGEHRVTVECQPEPEPKASAEKKWPGCTCKTPSQYRKELA
jgi:hypothetical protein